MWSAFERYLPIIGSKQEKCEALFHSHDPQALVNKVLALDKDNRLFTYIKERVTNQTLARNLDLYGKGTLSNVSYLLSAIRHIFGHGHLTPVSNDADANTTVSLCDLLSDFHMKGMDDDFSKRVTNVMEETEATQEYYSAR